MLVPEIERSEHGHDFEIDEIIPSRDPSVQQVNTRSFHELKASGSSMVDPTSMIRKSVGQHSSTSYKRLEIAAISPGRKRSITMNIIRQQGLSYVGHNWAEPPRLSLYAARESLIRRSAS